MTSLNKIYALIGAILLGIMSLTSCETEVILELPDAETQLVVDGRIFQDSIPIISLTRNVPFYGTVDVNTVEDLFVNDAHIQIWTGEDTVVLQEESIYIDSLDLTIFVYTNFLFEGEAGKTYNLRIETQDGQILTSETHVPHINPLDSIWFVHKPEIGDGQWGQVFVEFDDPDTLGNYYRIFLQKDSDFFETGDDSVFDDAFINGEKFPFFIDSLNDDEDLALDEIALFRKGMNVTVRMAGIDRAHYNFWNTLEYDSNTQGPFATTTKVAGNIEGGLGIWGGYSASDISIQIPE